MKNLVLNFILAILSFSTAFAQMEQNGTVYIEHPAIDVVESLNKAMVNGDSASLSGLLTDDFKAYNGVSADPDTKGQDKVAFVSNAMRWFRDLDYFSISDSPGAYPDAIKYTKENEKDQVWVQTWEMIKGVHKATGVKITSPVHRLYKLTKDNKINTLISYTNESIFEELRSSYSDRTNGTIYDHHDNINTVRKMVYAMEYGDMEKSYSFFSPDASFYDINTVFGESETLDGIKSNRKNFFDAFELKSIEMIGYPDYLEYERDNGRSVLSWWNLHLVRKSDKKEIKLPMHLDDSFDENGNITSEVLYYSRSLLEQE